MRLLRTCVILILVDLTVSTIDNGTTKDVDINLKGVETRRKKSKKHRSTSSDSRDRAASDSKDEAEDSLQLSSSSTESSDKKDGPKSSLERKGWRKWHRKCQTCPEDMVKKWNDPSILWICGGYQRARRSFKSTCMMHYRNCQDGTMFVKLHDHRCANSTREKAHGLHFFYDYKVGSDSSKTDDSTLESEGSSSF